ncbi:MAG: PqqD family protein [Alphaproteobacteria bacterium]|nr:PqqD family protein [Alphaproteobacteria bacterium]
MAFPIADTDEIRCAPDVLSTEVDAEMVLMHVARRRYYGLDAIGMAIWQRLGQPMRLADLCAGLAGEYDADRATIERDVRLLLERMAEEGLIEVTH